MSTKDFVLLINIFESKLQVILQNILLHVSKQNCSKGVKLACEHALTVVHVSQFFHLFLISPIFIITETRACFRKHLANIPYFGILYFYC